MVALGDRVCDVRPPAQRDLVPMDLDVGMVTFALGELADPVHEGERLGEVFEAKLTLEGTVNQGVTVW